MHCLKKLLPCLSINRKDSLALGCTLQSYLPYTSISCALTTELSIRSAHIKGQITCSVVLNGGNLTVCHSSLETERDRECERLTQGDGERQTETDMCLFGVTSHCQTSSASYCPDARCQFIEVEVVTVALR